MKRNSVPLLSFVAIASLVLSACGGSSYSRIDSGGTRQCAPAANYNPIVKDLPTNENRSKASWPGSGGADVPLTAGEYEYVEMDFYFEDTSTGFQYHVGERKIDSPKGEEDDQKYEVRRVCARNTADIGPLNVSIHFPSDISITDGGKITSSTRALTVTFTDRLRVDGVPSDTLEQPPSKVTGDQNYVSQLYQTKANDGTTVFEDRMEDVSGPIKKFALIKYRLKKP